MLFFFQNSGISSVFSAFRITTTVILLVQNF